jgi:hypothetical protein
LAWVRVRRILEGASPNNFFILLRISDSCRRYSIVCIMPSLQTWLRAHPTTQEVCYLFS